ncbi:MAG: PH domain-containing protein [Methanoregula sp.]
MGIPYLNSDESILLSTHNILVDGAVSEAILTNRRLLIVDSSNNLSRTKEIPFAAIETVTTMESGSGDPALSLAILKKSGGTNPMQLVFTQQPRSQRTGERDDWAQKIKEQIALLPSGTAPAYVEFAEAEDLKTLIGSETNGTPAADRNVPAGTGPGRKASPSTRGKSPASAASGRKMVIVAAAIVVVILLIAGAVFIYPSLTSPKVSVPTPVPTPVPATAATLAPVTTAAPTPEPTPVATVIPEQTPASQPTVVTTIPAQTSIPANGVWVRVMHDAKYTGSVGTGGRLREVSGTGENFYQVPATSTDIIEASIQKFDTAGIPLTVEVYNNGELIKRSSIITPKGTLLMSVNLKTATTPVVTPTVIPTTAS